MKRRLPSHRPNCHRCDGPARGIRLVVVVAVVLSMLAAWPDSASAGKHYLPDTPSGPSAAPVCSPDWLDTALDALDGSVDSRIALTGDERSSIAPYSIAESTDSLPDASLHGLAWDPSSPYPQDPLFRFYQRRSLMLMGALDAWDTSRGSSDITVAVISTGVKYDHPDLATKIWRNKGEIPGNGLDDDGNGYIDDVHGWNFPADSNDPMDIPRGGGTMMAGIVGAATSNNEGIAGTSWGARIMPLKILVLLEEEHGNRAVGTLRDLVEAVCYAANNGAQVILFGGFLNDPDNAGADLQRLQQAIRYARNDANAALVAPAGDCGLPEKYCPPPEYGPNPPMFPAAFAEEVIGAQSFGIDYTERAQASSGYWVDISAPGEGFWTTTNNDPPYTEIKTPKASSDFAAAHVAGVLAVMRGVNPDTSPAQLEDLLCQTSDRPRGVEFDLIDGRPHNDKWGCGYVNFDHAVDTVEPLLRVSPTSLSQFTDGSKPWPRLVFENPHLRASRWTIAPQDAVWLTPEGVIDETDGASRAYVQANLDQLESERGSPLTAGAAPVSARLTACPLGNHAGEQRLCQDLEYELRFVDQVYHAHLPAVVNSAPLGDTGTGPVDSVP